MAQREAVPGKQLGRADKARLFCVVRQGGNLITVEPGAGVEWGRDNGYNIGNGSDKTLDNKRAGDFVSIEERARFWDKLASLKGEDSTNEFKELSRTIVLPKALYRYRAVNTRTLEALRTNRLYFSTANYYDDPFDTFINVNIREMQEVIEAARGSGKDIKECLNVASKRAGLNIPPEFIDCGSSLLVSKLQDPAFCSRAVNYVRNIRNEVKKDVWSACFSESDCNEVLWLKYAEQHKGFALRYDLDKPELFMCGKSEKCRTCGLANVRAALCPIYYSPQMYDGTRFAQFICIAKLLQLDSLKQQKLKRYMGVTDWELIKLSVIKKECHQYDEEWRLILMNWQLQSPVCQEWIPGAVILGLNMDSGDKELVTTLVKEAGIEEMYQCIIGDDGGLVTERVN